MGGFLGSVCEGYYLMSILDRAELLLRARDYGGSGAWVDASGNGHNATNNGATFLNYGQKGKHARMPGTTGNYFSTADVNLLIADIAHSQQGNLNDYWDKFNIDTVPSPADPYDGDTPEFGDYVMTLTTTTVPTTYQGYFRETDGYGVSKVQNDEVSVRIRLRLLYDDLPVQVAAQFFEYQGPTYKAESVTSFQTLTPGEWTDITTTYTVVDALTDTVRAGFRFRHADLATTLPASTDMFEFDTMMVVDGLTAPTEFTPSLRIVGDLDIRAKVALNDWDGADQLIMGNPFPAGTSVPYGMRSFTDGSLYCYAYDGATDVYGVTHATAGLVDGVAAEIKYTLDLDGDANIYVDDTNVYTLASATAGPLVGSGDLDVAGRAAGNTINGDLYWAEVRDGVDGPVVARYDVDDNGVADTSFTGYTDGRTWTVNRSSSGAVTTIVDRNAFLFTTDDYFTAPANAELGPDAAGEELTVFVVQSKAQSILGGSSVTLISTLTSGATTGSQGWSIYDNHSHANDGFTGYINDGTTQNWSPTGNPTAQTLYQPTVVALRVTDSGSGTHDFYVDGAQASTDADPTTGDIYNTANPVYIGGGPANSFFEGTISDVVLFREALSDNEIHLVSLALSNGVDDPQDLHGDALLQWILTYEDRTYTADSELVGILNEINGTTGKEYAEARGTYLVAPPAG